MLVTGSMAIRPTPRLTTITSIIWPTPGTTTTAAIKRTPVGRMGKPEDIAAACAFFISEEAGYITGQILGVNGGRNT